MNRQDLKKKAGWQNKKRSNGRRLSKPAWRAPKCQSCPRSSLGRMNACPRYHLIYLQRSEESCLSSSMQRSDDIQGEVTSLSLVSGLSHCLQVFSLPQGDFLWPPVYKPSSVLHTNSPLSELITLYIICQEFLSLSLSLYNRVLSSTCLESHDSV